jgi:alpha-N-arabinofuranosidase
LFLQTIYHPLQLFAKNSKGTALELFVDSPKYTSRRFGEAPYLDTSAAYDDGTLVLNVVNRHGDRAIAADIELEDKEFSGPVTVTEVNGPDIKAENDFGSVKVKPVERTAPAQGKRLTMQFAPHSFTMLKVKLV